LLRHNPHKHDYWRRLRDKYVTTSQTILFYSYQVQEQAERLRMAELKLKEAEYMSREKEMASDR